MFDAKPVPDPATTTERLARSADGSGPYWQIAFEVLRRRPGWRLERDKFGDHCWFFGPDGQGRLAVSAEPDGLGLFIWRTDADCKVTTARELWRWLLEHEAEEEEYGFRTQREFWADMRRERNREMAQQFGEDASRFADTDA